MAQVAAKPIINLSVIEEVEHTLALNSNSDNETKRNISGYQAEFLKLKQSSSSHSLAMNPVSAAPKLQKKTSFDATKNMKPNLTLDTLDENNEQNDNMKKPPKNHRSISDNPKNTDKDEEKKEKSTINEKTTTINSEKKIAGTNEIPPLTGESEKNKPVGNFFPEQGTTKSLKFSSEMKNFVRKKCTLGEFQTLLQGFFAFDCEGTHGNDDKSILGAFTKFWQFFFQGIQIILYVQKETKSLINKFKKNFKDILKIKESLQKYHKTVDFEEYLHKKRWKGYLDELMKCQELNEEIITKMSFLMNFLGHYLDETLEKPSENELIEKNLFSKVLETFTIFESNLKTLNSYAGLTGYSEERLGILTKIEKKESFFHFLDFFNNDVKNRNFNDLKILFGWFVGYLSKIIKIIDKENGKERVFHRNLYENCLVLTELATIITKKVSNIQLLKKSCNDNISAIFLPFYDHIEKNYRVLDEVEKNLHKILKKVKKLKKRVKYIREQFPNNFFLNLREGHCINLITELKELKCETLHELEIMPYFREYPNYELEIINMQSNCQQFQTDFQSNQDKEMIRDKVIWLAGKLHNMRVFMKDLQAKDGNKNAILRILHASMQSHLSATYKLYDFLLKILNSAHANELQKIKLIEGEVERKIDILSLYYESLQLPIGLRTDEMLIEMKATKLELDNYSLLLDLPDIYRDICSAKSTQLEQEIEKLEVFEEIREKGRERIDFNSIRNVILGLIYDKKSTELEQIINQIEKYLKIGKYIGRMHSSIQNVLERGMDMRPALKVFNDVYGLFFMKFQKISDNYEEVKRVVAGGRELLLDKLIIAMGACKKEDKHFFVQCAEFFFINTKNYFQGLIPENIDHIFNQTNHLMREVKGKIDNFYENRENMKVMAVGYTRQIHILKSIDQYREILNRIGLGDQEQEVKVRSIGISLEKLKFIIEVLLKPCMVANRFEDFLDDLVKNKHLDLDVRIDKLKEMLKDINEKLRVLEQEERKGIKDEKIASIYVYIKDDIKKVNDYIMILLPDIEEFAKLTHLVEKKKLKLILEDDVIQNIKWLYEFQQRINKTPGANQKLAFQDQNKINDFIQEYYTHWYENIHNFLNNFDFESIAKLLQCYSVANQKNLLKIMDEYAYLQDKIAHKYVGNRTIFLSECKDLRHTVHTLKRNVQEVDLAIFILSNINIDRKKFRYLNEIHGLKEFKDICQEKFKLELWKELTDWSYKTLDKICSVDHSKTIYKTLMEKEMKVFKEKVKGVEMPLVHKKWFDTMIQLFEQ